MQLGGITKFCPVGYFWAWVFQHILARKSDKKIAKIHKDFE